MSYVLIKGSFHVVGQSPDGDSLKFRAANTALWDSIQTEYRDLFLENFKDNLGVVNLRLGGIDALETHYTPPRPLNIDFKSKSYAQPEQFGRFSTNAFLEMLGVTEVKWRTFGRNTFISQAVVHGRLVKTKLNDHIPGFIITGDIELNGRPVAWVFTGDSAIPDGTILNKQQLAELIPNSANYHLLRKGLVYPMFFSSMPAVVRAILADAVKDALTLASQHVPGDRPPPNIWLIDYSVRGLELTSVNLLTDTHAIYPYLFRRIIKHYQNVEIERLQTGLESSQTIPLANFFSDGNPTMFVVSEQEFLRLDEIVETQGMTIRMKKAPHDLVFLG
jgi:hypothetical protein